MASTRGGAPGGPFYGGDKRNLFFRKGAKKGGPRLDQARQGAITRRLNGGAR